MSRRSRVVVALTYVALGCGGREIADAGTLLDATATDDVAAQGFDAASSSTDGALAPPDAVPPPTITCSDEDAGSCALPQSVCIDGQWLEYFDDGTCVDGGCHYDIVFYECACGDAGCIHPPTTPHAR